MIDEALFDAEEKMEKAVAVARDDLSTIRTGRANPGMFSRITIDYYGAATPITQLASINVPEARLVVIKPYEANQLRAIETAIRNSDLGVNPPTTAPLFAWPYRSSPKNVGESWSNRQSIRGRRPRFRCVISVAKRWRNSIASVRKARPARMRSVAQKRISTRPRTNTSPKLMSWLNTKKASCWRSSGRSATKSVTTNDAGTGNPAEQPARGAKQQPATETSRAGRDLRAAIVVGLSIGLVLIAVLVFVPRVWVAIVAVATLVATHEVVRRLREAGYLIPVIPLLIGGQAAVWLTWPFGAVGALAGFGGMVVVCMIWRLFMQDSVTRPTTGGAPSPGNYLSDVSATVFLAVWVPLFCSFGAMLVYPENGSGWVFCMMIAVIASDVGGYAVGCCLASIRWFRRSARRSRGRALPVRWCAGSPQRSSPRLSWSAKRRGLVHCSACFSCSPPRWATWWSRRSNVTSASKTWAACYPATAV